MTKIKLCGLSRPCDIEAANALMPEYVGFVFAPKSRRYVSAEKAAELRRALSPDIAAVGVFVDEEIAPVAALLNSGIIDIAQLHGSESGQYIEKLRRLTDKPLIQAFRIASGADVAAAEQSPADYVLLDSGEGTGRVFDWDMIQNLSRPYFLAGGLTPGNAADAVGRLHPYAVDVSSGIETGGFKDNSKMAEFVSAVRKGRGL